MDELGSFTWLQQQSRERNTCSWLKMDASANVELSSNEMLWGFEADIVIRVYDGWMLQAAPRTQTYHQRGDRRPKARAHARTRGFTQRQDEHLRLAHGMRVVRWDLMSQGQKKDDEIMRDFRDLIRDL
jgi:hypothetical protein